MKKMTLMILGLCLVSGLFANVNPVNTKVLTAFKAMFSTAENIRWAEDKNHYVAKFTLNDVRYTVYYNEYGNITNTMKIYKPSELPANVLTTVQNNSDKQLTGVTEISNTETRIYFVRMEDENYYYTIKTDDSKNYQVHEKIKKAK